MDSLRSIIPKVLSKRGIATQAHASLVVHKAQAWLNEVLPALAAELTVQKVQDSVLVIECKNSIAAQECAQLSSRLLEYLRKECGKGPERVQTVRS